VSDNKIEIVNGKRRVVFVRTEDGWKPDWFYEGDRPMLRFKDHEWLSIGHVHPTVASHGEKVGNKAVFRGEALYGTVTVAWSVTVKPDRACKGFMVETEFTPGSTIELMEAFTSYETPYEYDGGEHVTTVIGQNPITQWKGPDRVTPKQWAHPMWCYNRDEYVHMTGPCDTPLLVQTVANADGSNARYTAIVGDWNVCSVHETFATPTRTVKLSDDFNWGENKLDNRRGYKYIVAGVNWSSSLAKDPNIMYDANRRQRQRLYITFGTPKGHLDELLMALRRQRRRWVCQISIDVAKDRALLTRIGGAIIILLGLHYVGVLRIGFLDRSVSRGAPANLTPLKSLAFGMTFGISGSACTTFFLGTALMLAMHTGSLPQGLAMLFCFSMGLGLPFALVALLYHRLTHALAFIRRHMRAIQIVSGALLIGFGLALVFDAFGYWSRLFA